MVRQYIRDKKNQKVGLLVGLPDDKNEKVLIGFSKCNTKHDKFDRELAIKIAEARAKKYSDQLINKYNIPFKVMENLPDFMERCGKYFKDKEMPNWYNV